MAYSLLKSHALHFRSHDLLLAVLTLLVLCTIAQVIIGSNMLIMQILIALVLLKFLKTVAVSAWSPIVAFLTKRYNASATTCDATIKAAPFKPFVRSNPCPANVPYHVPHISCHNEKSYVQYVEDYLAPLRNFEKANPYPMTFHKVRPCDFTDMATDHVDHVSCCNYEEYKVYKEWVMQVLVPLGYGGAKYCPWK